VGPCFDNAAAEAFFSMLENEVLSRHRFTTRAQGRSVVVAGCPGLLQHSTQAQLSPIAGAGPLREDRRRQVGRGITPLI
jgi:hypothetical protein